MHQSQSAEVFGSKSLKSIYNNIDMVQQTDKHKKEKTKRRFQAALEQAAAVTAAAKSEKKPPIPQNHILNIKTLNIESLSEDDEVEIVEARE